jgi:hypothetical protein
MHQAEMSSSRTDTLVPSQPSQYVPLRLEHLLERLILQASLARVVLFFVMKQPLSRPSHAFLSLCEVIF